MDGWMDVGYPRTLMYSETIHNQLTLVIVRHIYIPRELNWEGITVRSNQIMKKDLWK